MPTGLGPSVSARELAVAHLCGDWAVSAVGLDLRQGLEEGSRMEKSRGLPVASVSEAADGDVADMILAEGGIVAHGFAMRSAEFHASGMAAAAALVAVDCMIDVEVYDRGRTG